MYRTGVFSNFGPLTRELESRYAEFLGVRPEQVVSVANCTLGIEGAIALSAAESWLVPDFTFAATGLAVLRSGKPLLLGDVDENTWTLLVDLLEGLDERVGVLPVAPFGAALDLNPWIGRRHAIIDAAASLGTQPDLSSLPKEWCVAFSLHATKVLPAGEGGLVVFGQKASAERFRRWANFGFSDSRTSVYAGTNAKMSEIHAAYGLASLDGWEAERRDWVRARTRAQQACIEAGLPQQLHPLPGLNPYWIVDCASLRNRERLEARLAESGIASRRWWPAALHEMPAFRSAPLAGSNSSSRLISGRLLGLPMYRDLELVAAKHIASVVADHLVR